MAGRGHVGTLRRIVGAVDHATFWVAVVAGIAGWIYIESRRVPPAFTREYRGQLRRFLVLSLAAACALIVSVIGDGVLTFLRLAGKGWSLEILIPVLSMTAEATCAGLLLAYLRRLSQRTTSAPHTPPG